jgi:hypothetical protein
LSLSLPQCLAAGRDAPLKTQRFYSALVILQFEPFQPLVEDVIKRVWEYNLNWYFKMLPPRAIQNLATRSIAASFGPETVANNCIRVEYTGTDEEKERKRRERCDREQEQRNWKRKKRFGGFVCLSWSLSLAFWCL